VQADRGSGSARTTVEAIQAEPFLHGNPQSVPAAIHRLHTHCQAQPESTFVKEAVMPGSLNDILPEPISPENEAVLLIF